MNPTTFKQQVVRYAPPQLVHWGKYLVDSAYRHRSRHLARLKRVPRYRPAVTEILGRPLEVVDSASFLWMYREIFVDEIYRFRARTDEPYIIDCGANIGLSVLYFKQLYPRARVAAFEPDREIFEVLSRNVAAQGHGEGVELHRRAVWTEETTLSFWSEGADGGRLSDVGDGVAARGVEVPTARLRDFLGGRVDFLKVDIEGAETEVLEDCADRLGEVEHLFVEYHSFAERPQTLHRLTTLLADAGFRLHIQPVIPSPRPFVQRHVEGGMDMQLNVFAFRA
ncbi:MAG TPA: FkbM family methyltransferase [Pyrinomonadaceae bacterium]|nr:FkbM family methyltransferase [Pyrinomonadaceae bacterium]